MLRKTILNAAAAVAASLLAVSFAAAQTSTAQSGAKPAAAQADPAKVRAEIDKAIESLRKDVRAGKADILGKTMELDATQAAAFWPLYKQYDTELAALGSERVAIIQDLAEHWDSLDDAKAKGLLERQVSFEEKRLALTRKYKDEMLKVLPAKTVARFLQVENRLGKLVDLTIASEIPLVY
jgi:hypothetical protein